MNALARPLPESLQSCSDPAAGLPAPRTDSPAAGHHHISILFAAIDRSLATMPAFGDQANHINIQIEAWEGRERQMMRWARTAKPGAKSPFAPWTAADVAIVHARLGAQHAALVDKIKAVTAEAIAKLPEECR